MTPSCPRAALGEPLEIYPGPGAFCPDCGERLIPREPQPQRPRQPAWHRTAMLAGLCCVTIVAVALAVVIGRPAIGALHVRVCSTGATDRVVRSIVDTFTAQHLGWPHVYDVTAPGDLACDVRFRAATNGNGDAVIARDGMVVIVNPGNPLARITADQLREVLSGRITDWSQLGAPAGPLVAALPADRPDATSILADRVMHGANAAARVVRTLGTDAVVRVVSSPSGRGAIAVVPFSSAEPAKVLALGDVAPNPISIADEHYPLTFRIVVDSDFRHPPRAAAELIAFARSANARPLVARTALVSAR